MVESLSIITQTINNYTINKLINKGNNLDKPYKNMESLIKHFKY